MSTYTCTSEFLQLSAIRWTHASTAHADEHYHRFEQPQTASVGPHQDAPALMEEMQEQ